MTDGKLIAIVIMMQMTKRIVILNQKETKEDKKQKLKKSTKLMMTMTSGSLMTLDKLISLIFTNSTSFFDIVSRMIIW